MFDVKRWRYGIFPLAVVLLFMMGIFGCEIDEEEANNGEIREEEEIDEDNPYDEAEEIVPMEDRIIAMDEDFRAVLEEIFAKEPKLVSTSEFQPVNYVVDRVITDDDVSKIKALLEEKGYETVKTSAEENEYEFDISISEETLEEKYEGNVGGNMYVVVSTAEEGEEAQRIYVKTL